MRHSVRQEEDSIVRGIAIVALTITSALVVSGIKRKNRAVETMDAKQLAEHISKRAQRGRVCDVGFRPDRLETAP